MADTSLPALAEELPRIEVADSLKMRLTASRLAWAEDRLVPTSSNIPDRSSLAGLREEFELACLPADKDTLEMWLTMLWVGTKKQSAMNEFRLENVMRVYIAALSRYPADLVEKALSTWTSTPKPREAHHWWPSIGEIEDAIRGPADTRRMITNGLREWDMDKGKHARLSQLYRDLGIIEGGDFTFAVRHLMDAPREVQIDGLEREADRLRKEIKLIEGVSYFAKAAGDN
jgi:hypothetical protein